MMPVNFNTTHKENNFECTICISLYHVYREHFIYFYDEHREEKPLCYFWIFKY